MRVTVKNIADELGISQGTVSKALMGKKGISEKTRTSVLEAAERMGYKVNRIAQTLSRTTIRIGVISTREWIPYYGEIMDGIEQEATQLMDYNVETIFQWVYNPWAETEVEAAVSALKEQKVSGILFCLATAAKYIHKIKELMDSDIPLILVGTYISELPECPSVRLDSNLAGHLAAEFMTNLVPKDKSTAIFVGNKSILEHRDKERGYVDGMESAGRMIAGIYETQDDTELAHVLTRKTVRDFPNLGGIYVATGNAISVCRCIEELGLTGNVKVIGTDIYPDVVPEMENGVMQGIIYQNPKQQGKIAMNSIYRWISERKAIHGEILVMPLLALKSNVKRLLNEQTKTNKTENETI